MWAKSPRSRSMFEPARRMRTTEAVRAAAFGATGLLHVACGGATPDDAGLGGLLIRTIAVLAFVSLLAVLTLRLAARYGVGGLGPKAAGRRMEVLERIPLGPRHAAVALRVKDRVLIVGQSAGQITRLGELTLSEWSEGGFSRLLDPPVVGSSLSALRGRGASDTQGSVTPASSSESGREPGESADFDADARNIGPPSDEIGIVSPDSAPAEPGNAPPRNDLVL